MLGNPMFGVGYMQQTSGSRRKGGSVGRKTTTGAAEQPIPPPQKPGLFAPRGEKQLWKAIAAQDPAAIEQVGSEFADYRVAAYSVAGMLFAKVDRNRAERLLSMVLDGGQEPATDPFLQKYTASEIMLPIAPGVSAEMPLCRDGLGLLLAEIRQERGDLQEAIDAVEVLEPTTYAAVSLAELYSQVGRHADVIELTEGLANEDDASALLLVYRGIALRAEGIPDAALEALNLALRARSRDKAIRLLAYSERASVYVELGRKAMARKDLGRILAEDSTYEGVQQRLEELQ
jgi:tetratricopeptide (TPR) repeat protein